MSRDVWCACLHRIHYGQISSKHSETGKPFCQDPLQYSFSQGLTILEIGSQCLNVVLNFLKFELSCSCEFDNVDVICCSSLSFKPL